ncbi:MAG: transcription antitermination factor NusB [Verrucomicrobiales bacterium]|nr:transcription antitermination factor NusB [Verrucomicrobiales bacterium]MCP5559768.1 transcription antitermination factor NusB [Verrucomicrobiaceae bacterium]
MGKRREGREAAVQYLFAHDLHGQPKPEDMSSFWDVHNARPGVRKYAEELIQGVLGDLPEIDRLLENVVQNFRIERLASVDRNILRLAIYELRNVKDVPTAVILNEAIEIAKTFGAGESGGFVNGVLDRLTAEIRGRAREVAPAAPTVPSPAAE